MLHKIRLKSPNSIPTPNTMVLNRTPDLTIRCMITTRRFPQSSLDKQHWSHPRMQVLSLKRWWRRPNSPDQKRTSRNSIWRQSRDLPQTSNIGPIHLQAGRVPASSGRPTKRLKKRGSRPLRKVKVWPMSRNLRRSKRWRSTWAKPR